MRNTALTTALLSALALTACDIQDETLDGGLDPDSGSEAPLEVQPPVYTWVVVTDTSAELNPFGAPGADICGVSFDCGGDRTGYGVDAELWEGDGDFCHAGERVNGEACFADRDDPLAAVGEPHDPCEADSNPSHYVALGVGGVLAVRLDTEAGDLDDRGLAGCAITVHERVNRDEESYAVSVCVDAGGVQCHQPRLADAPAGGELRFVVPMP